MARASKDKLGDRMKDNFENRCRFFLPRRTYTILRVDGRAFHTWTKGLSKPYDTDLMDCMDAAAIALCKEIAGVRFAFVQSDEISVLATDFSDESSQSWFDGNVQKWSSVAASIATMAFNSKVVELNRKWDLWDSVDKETAPAITKKEPNAVFDARVFTIPDYIEVENYFVWRQQDASRNSVTLLASAYASHKKLHGKSIAERHEIIHKAGDNWAKHPVRFKHGAMVRKLVTLDLLKAKEETLNAMRTKTNNEGIAEAMLSDPLARTSWCVDTNTPVFTRNRDYLRSCIPRHWENDETTKRIGNE